MSSPPTRVSRPMVGFCAIACLAAWLALFFFPDRIESPELWQGSFLRIGLVLAAFWLALPSRSRDAAWSGLSGTTFVAILVAAFFAARYRYAVIPILVVVAIAGVFLRPRDKQRPRERPV